MPPAAPTLRRLRDALDTATRTGCALVLPVSLLLAAQWPLRDALGRYPREANDLAQCLFAFYVALAVYQAGRRGAHLAVEGFARRLSPALRDGLQRLATAALLLPWAVFTAVAGWFATWQSVLQLEAFPETNNPGYFLLRVAMLLLVALVALQVLFDLALGNGTPPDHG